MKFANLATIFTALLVSAGAAHGQNLKAEIPFSFHIPGATMDAGHYQLLKQNTAGGRAYYRLYDVDSRESVLVAAAMQIGGGPAPIKPPRLVFRCVARSCELSEIWEAGTNVGIAVSPSKRLNKEEGAQVATVFLKNR